MIAKESKLYSVLHSTCPRCHEGEVFNNSNPYHSLDFTQINDRCDRCGQSFEPEPGFYQGAMYVSYALSLGLAFVVSLVMLLLFDANVWLITIVLSVLLIGLLPVLFRLSRIVWLNLFVPYKPNSIQKSNK